MEEKSNQAAFMSALVTEHFVLQSAASTTVGEAGVRASLYVFSLSSALVAMGFTAQSPSVFVPLVATVIPAVFVMGWFTVVRLVDTTVENLQFLRAIARIRRYYRTLTPDAAVYFAPWETNEDEGAEALAVMAVKPGGMAPFFTTASMVSTINGLVGGVGVAMLAGQPLGRPAAIPLGAAAALAFIGVGYVYQRRRLTAAAKAAQHRWAPSAG